MLVRWRTQRACERCIFAQKVRRSSNIQVLIWTKSIILVLLKSTCKTHLHIVMHSNHIVGFHDPSQPQTHTLSQISISRSIVWKRGILFTFAYCYLPSYFEAAWKKCMLLFFLSFLTKIIAWNNSHLNTRVHKQLGGEKHLFMGSCAATPWNQRRKFWRSRNKKGMERSKQKLHLSYTELLSVRSTYFGFYPSVS